jgi:hypothetical protein
VTTKTEFKPGDVVRYDVADRWCREGTAIAATWKDQVVLLDTYWQSSDQHRLTDDEVATAELLFNLADFDELPSGRHLGSSGKWMQYSPADRKRITAQHGLVVRYFIRKGAQPDLATQIENARQAVADAYEKLRNAERDVDYARRKLARLEAAQ